MSAPKPYKIVTEPEGRALVIERSTSAAMARIERWRVNGEVRWTVAGDTRSICEIDDGPTTRAEAAALVYEAYKRTEAVK